MILSSTERIMRNLIRLPRTPYKPPSAPKPKGRAANKGRVHKGKSRS